MKLLTLTLTILATQATAQQTDFPCFNRDEFVHTLDQQYGEIKIATMEETNGTPLELYVMPNGYWAIGVLQEGVVCILDKGYNFTPQARGELG